MKNLLRTLLLPLLWLPFNVLAQSAGDLRIVFIRHAEKPATGDQLSCAGLNRALQLPKVLVAKYGVPNSVYVPTISGGKATKAARMLETAWPLATKHNLAINSKFDVDDKEGLAANLLKKSGTVLVVWEHNALPKIMKALGVHDKQLNWPGSDFDSIWVVTIHNGKAKLATDRENIQPAANCNF
ncbi:histidine phosphatase family protein [Mucilaginibacter pedocola]|uniref:Histidine phosphatase family protein n=1 Tax=Mucilaginibacter pedocola TaxID=1792845 RepID=A0A1S9PJW1_9SPHI|nr:histidine phosphatase family protein [Mucilaginibacter pedocola]OOQ61199.1 hypothetical protein BC343_22430 [Mucilaginibacter pedocola]